jgi:hypothetical protein
VGSRLEQRLPSPRLVSACRLAAAPGLDPARRLVSPARLGSTAGVGRTLCRTTLRSVPPTALRVVHALSLLPDGAGSEPIGDRVDDVVANANADAGARHGWRQRGEIRSIATS